MYICIGIQHHFDYICLHSLYLLKLAHYIPNMKSCAINCFTLMLLVLFTGRFSKLNQRNTKSKLHSRLFV